MAADDRRRASPAGMTEPVQALEVWQIKGDVPAVTRLEVVREVPVTIFFNGREIVTLLCTGQDLRSLAVGFLWLEGFLTSRESLDSVEVDREQWQVRVRAKDTGELATRLMGRRTLSSSCGKGTLFYHVLDSLLSRPIESPLAVEVAEIRTAMAALNQLSFLYRRTRGVHNCGLAKGGKIVIFRADIGRHNAVDMIAGTCFLEGVPLTDKTLVTTGRITSEIVIKAGKMGIPLLASRAAATSLAVELARELRITVIGRVRGGSMVVYHGSDKLVDLPRSGQGCGGCASRNLEV